MKRALVVLMALALLPAVAGATPVFSTDYSVTGMLGTYEDWSMDRIVVGDEIQFIYRNVDPGDGFRYWIKVTQKLAGPGVLPDRGTVLLADAVGPSGMPSWDDGAIYASYLAAYSNMTPFGDGTGPSSAAVPVPEPASMLLLGGGLLGLARVVRRRGRV